MLLFPDVDGTLLPFGAAGAYPLYALPGEREEIEARRRS